MNFPFKQFTMQSGSQANKDVPIQFIDSTHQSSRQIKINRHLVRSHVSKLNRRHAKAVAEEQLPGLSASPKQLVARKAETELRSVDSWDACSGGSSSEETASTGSDTEPTYFIEDGSIDSLHGDIELLVASNDWMQDFQSILDLRTVSPFLGAISTEAFTNDASFSVSQSADYCRYPCWLKSGTNCVAD